MINRRLMLLILAIGLVAAACGNEQLGRALPACEGDLNGTMIIQIQSVPEAEYVPCIVELQLGWEYVDLVPKLGNSRFTINSDRAGDDFLEVILSASCQVDSSLEKLEILPGLDQYRDVTLVPTNAFVVIAIGDDRDLPYAEEVEELLESEDFDERRVFVSIDQRDVMLAEKIEDAHSIGRAVVAIEEQDQLNDPKTAGVAFPGEPALRRAVDLDQLVSSFDMFLDKPSYRGNWVTVFDGGCITYLFDAEGPGVLTLVQDVGESLGLYPARQVQQQLRDAGVLG